MVDKFSSSAKLGVYIPKFNRWSQYFILHITRPYFSSSLVLNVMEVSVMLNLDNPISRSPLKVPFARLLIFEIYSVSYLEERWCTVHGLSCCLKWFSSKVLLVMASASLWASKFSIPESGSPKNHCIGSNSWWRGKFGSLLYTKKNGISAVAKLGVTVADKNLVDIFIPVWWVLFTELLQGWF